MPHVFRYEVVILENVMGLKRVMQKVKEHLQKCGAYLLEVLEINPVHLGADLQRPRVYIVMIHESVLDRGTTTSSLARCLQSGLQKLQKTFESKPKRKWETLLFADTEPIVKKWRKARNRKGTESNCGYV